MALIRTGGLVEHISGSIGGITYSHNRFGPYARQRSMPVNPATARQEVVRNLMKNLTSIWISTLLDIERKQWDAYAAAVVMQNNIGANVYLTGFNHYVRSNIARMQAGLARVDVGPSAYALPATDPLISIALTASDDGISVGFDVTLPWADETGGALLCFGGPSRSVTKEFFAGPYRFMGMVEGDDAVPPTTPAALTSAYPFPQAD